MTVRSAQAHWEGSLIEGQLRALEKFSRENVSRTLLEHVDRVVRGGPG